MPISNNIPRNQYVASTDQTVFTYTFQIFDEDDLDVYTATTDAISDAVLLTVNADYTVSGVGVGTGGAVTLLTEAIAGNIITIIRNVENARQTDYQQSGNFGADTVDEDFDRLWAKSQEYEQTFLTTFRLSATATSTPDLAVPTPIADQIIGWNGAGTGLENKILADFGQVSLPIPITSGGTGGITAPAARTNLGIGLEQSQIWTGDHSFVGDTALNGKLAVGPGSELTIATGAITATGNYHTLDTEADAVTDDLATISTTGFASGSRLTLNPADDARTVVVKHNPTGSGTIGLRDEHDLSLENASDYLTLQLDTGGTWREINRSKKNQATPGWTYAPEQDWSNPATDTSRIIVADIAPWASEIEIFVSSVTMTGFVGALLTQLGTAGGIDNTNYLAEMTIQADSDNNAITGQAGFTIGFPWSRTTENGFPHIGEMVLKRTFGNTWQAQSWARIPNVINLRSCKGTCALTGPLTQIRMQGHLGTQVINTGLSQVRWR